MLTDLLKNHAPDRLSKYYDADERTKAYEDGADAGEVFTGWEVNKRDVNFFETQLRKLHKIISKALEVTTALAIVGKEGGLDPKRFHKLENQQNQGSCQGHSLSSGMEGEYWFETQCDKEDMPDISRNGAYRLSQVEDGIRGDDGSTLNGGVVAARKGICSEAIWPYTSSYQSRIPKAVYNARRDGEINKDVFKLTTAVPIRKNNQPHKQCLQALIDGVGIPALGMAWVGMDNSYEITNYRGSSRAGGHAICFPGFFFDDRDDLWFWLANSWGKRWGKDGYKPVHYTAFNKIMAYGWNMGFIYTGLKDLDRVRRPRFSFISDMLKDA